MFAFSQAKPYSGGIRSKVNIPLGEYLSVALEQGVHDSMFNSISSMTELDLEREGRIMTADEANKQYGIGTLKFEQDVHESVARTLNERKAAEMRRQYYLSQGNPGGLFSGRGLAGVGAGFLGSILNPLDFSVNFLPVVGSEAAAARLASRGAGPIRQTLARGLVTTEEALARSIPVAPRLTSALIQGAVGNFVAEVPHLVSALESKEDYTFADSVVNVAAGTVLGGALHLAVTSAARTFSHLSAGTRETMLRQAVDQFVKGEDIRVEKFVEIDPNIIRERVRFDENASILRNAPHDLDLQKMRQLVMLQHNSIKESKPFNLDLHEELNKLIGKKLTRSEYHKLYSGLFYLSDEKLTIPNLLESIKQNTQEEIDEFFGGMFITNDPNGPFIVDAEGQLIKNPKYDVNREIENADPETQKLVDDIIDASASMSRYLKELQEKESNIKALLESERAAWDEEGRFKKEMRAEIERQIAEGRTLTPEQADEWGFTKEPEKTEATLKEQSAQLKKDLDELMEEIGQVQEPAAKQELEAIAERTKKNLDAIEQAIACVIANPS